MLHHLHMPYPPYTADLMCSQLHVVYMTSSSHPKLNINSRPQNKHRPQNRTQNKLKSQMKLQKNYTKISTITKVNTDSRRTLDCKINTDPRPDPKINTNRCDCKITTKMYKNLMHNYPLTYCTNVCRAVKECGVEGELAATYNPVGALPEMRCPSRLMNAGTFTATLH